MPLLRKSDFRPYQPRIIQVIKENPFCLLTLGMGSGKTVCALTAATELMEEMKVIRVLIIAPVRVARDTWPDEFKQWEHLQDLSFRVCIGEMPVKERLAALLSGAEFIITNRENLKWLFENLPYEGYFNMIIYDESSRFKAGKARTPRKKDLETGAVTGGNTTEFGYVCRLRKGVSRFIELTGTPAPNGMEDLWGQIFVLDGGQRLGRSKHAFRKRYYYPSRNGYQFDIRPGSEEAILGAVSDIMFGLLEDEKAQLPPVMVLNHYAALPEKVMKEYKKLAREGASELYGIDAKNRAVLQGKLTQYANGSAYAEQEEGGRKVVNIHKEKLYILDEIIKEANGEPVLVAYNYDFDKQAIRSRYKGVVVADEDPDFVEKWNKRQIPILLAHPASVGHGLNLQRGGNIAVWFGLTWSLELYQQFNARLARPGQTSDKVIIHRILARGTVEQKVAEVLGEKDATQERVMEYIRQAVANYYQEC